MSTQRDLANVPAVEEVGSFDRHRGPVTCVAGIPGRSAAVSCGYDSAVAIIDFERRAIDLLGYHSHLVNRVVVNPEGTLAATCSSDYTVCLWDLEQRSPLRVLRGHWDDVEDFAFAGPGVGISVSRDRRILVWDLDTGAISRILEGHHRDVLSVEYAGGMIYTSGDDMTLRQWDLHSGAMVQCWGPFEEETDTCAIDTVHQRVILGADDGSIRIFDLASGESLRTIDAHSSGIKKVAVSPINGNILSAAYDQRILIWDAESFELLRELDPHAGIWERSLNWAPDGSQVLAGTFDGTAMCWNSADGRLLDEVGGGAADLGNGCLNDVTCAGELCATVSDDGLVRLAQLTAQRPIWTDRKQPGVQRVLMNAVCLSPARASHPSATLLWTGAHDHRLRVLGVEGEQLVGETELMLSEGPINCIRVLPLDPCEPQAALEAFVACYSGALVKVGWYGPGDLRIERKMQLHNGAVKALRLHSDGQRAISGAADGSLHVWRLDGELLDRLAGHTAIIDDVDFDPSGEFVASVSRDFTVNVYHFDSGRLVHSILLGRESPKCVLFWDRDTVLIGNYWGDILRVDLRDERISKSRIATNGIASLARCGPNLAAVSYDGSLSLLEPSSMELLSQLHCLQQKLPDYAQRASFDA